MTPISRRALAPVVSALQLNVRFEVSRTGANARRLTETGANAWRLMGTGANARRLILPSCERDSIFVIEPDLRVGGYFEEVFCEGPMLFGNDKLLVATL